MVTIRGRTLRERGYRNGEHGSTGEMCKIIVDDNSIGFDKAYTDRLFGFVGGRAVGMHTRKAGRGSLGAVRSS